MLSDIQRRILEVTARDRTLTNYVAGDVALNRRSQRIGRFIDVFCDETGLVRQTSRQDIATLHKAGFTVRITVEEAATVQVDVGRFRIETPIRWFEAKLERFFAAQRDADFGCRLHDVDLAVDKITSAAGHLDAGDLADLVGSVSAVGPLGPLIWAATAKTDHGPGRLIEELRRRVDACPLEELVQIPLDSPMEARQAKDELLAALGRAEVWARDEAPEVAPGQLFVDAKDRPVEATQAMIDAGDAAARALVAEGAVPKAGGS
ncbi:MAG: hypothetical protein OEM59_09440 [Rhodospirillales bacterium]|nr:hypothetical protein [Rhodospirillales bacterium]